MTPVHVHEKEPLAGVPASQSGRSRALGAEPHDDESRFVTAGIRCNIARVTITKLFEHNAGETVASKGRVRG